MAKPAPGKNAARAVAVPMRESEYASVNVRKIANGYIVSECTDGPKGYKSTERFTPTKPKITLPSTMAAPKKK